MQSFIGNGYLTSLYEQNILEFDVKQHKTNQSVSLNSHETPCYPPVMIIYRTCWFLVYFLNAHTHNERHGIIKSFYSRIVRVTTAVSIVDNMNGSMSTSGLLKFASVRKIQIGITYNALVMDKDHKVFLKTN